MGAMYSFGWRAALVMLFSFAANPAVADDVRHNNGAAKVVESFHAALKGGDSKTALAQLSDDAIIYESGYAETRDEYAHHHLKGDIEFASQTKRAVKSTTQKCGDSLCVIMQQSETTGKYKGKDVRSEGVETTVLRREGEIWKIQHVHWSSHK